MAPATATIVFIPYWASGHFMSMIEAGKRMLDASGGALSLTVLVMQAPTPAKAAEVEAHVRREEEEAAASSGLHDVRFVRLPAVEPPTGCAGREELNFRYIELHAPRVVEAVAALELPAAAIVADLFCTPLLDAGEVTVPRYVYFASTAAFLALMLHLPALREEGSDLFGEMEERGAVHVPGHPPVPLSHVPVCLSRRDNYPWFEYYGRRFMDATGGVIVNSSVELEHDVITAIADGCCVPGRPSPAVHAIGPVIWFSNGASGDRQVHECVRWLDAQPPSKVVFLCFGSIGFFQKKQVAEISAGLERSGHRFLRVLRGPPAVGSPYPTDADLDALLPDGFLERTKDRGLVWPRWAPQKDVLAHPAVGGFVTHCGWNSLLESLWFGVPMVPWPLYGEQHLNAFELVAEMGAAVPLKVDRERGNFVEAAELEHAMRSLMDGDEDGRKVREKAAEMKDACRNAVAVGGSSCAVLQKLVRDISSGTVAPAP